MGGLSEAEPADGAARESSAIATLPAMGRPGVLPGCPPPLNNPYSSIRIRFNGSEGDSKSKWKEFSVASAFVGGNLGKLSGPSPHQRLSVSQQLDAEWPKFLMACAIAARISCRIAPQG